MQTEFGIGASTITMHFGSITQSGAEVLVSSDDAALSMGGGVSEALRRAAGEVLYREAREVTPAQVGDVVVTGAGGLPAKYIFHAVTLDWKRPELPRDALVRRAVRKAMDLLAFLGCRSIAFPSIGAGSRAFHMRRSRPRW
jgi:O-acetyl-ADP-ribose deacetylase (regulator of RNase III)